MELYEQIIKAIQEDKADINRLKHGELTIVIQDGKAIRLEKLGKKKLG